MLPVNQKTKELALEIANNCQGGELSPCTSECPMHTDVMGYIGLIGENKIEEALLKIREKLFLPGTLGRICAHPCESKCKREDEYKESLSIASLKRYAADHADSKSLWGITRKPDTGKKIAVIGAGPAGAQVAIDLAKYGHNVVIFEKLPVLGGMMRVGIPEYRLPHDIIDFEYSYLDKLGIDIRLNTEVGKDISFKEIEENFDSVVIANGAHKGFIPPILGHNLKGVTTAVDFLKEVSLEGKSSFCTKNVVVVGGGDVAMDCARVSLRLGAESVILVSLEFREDLPASAHEIESSLEEGVILKNGYGICEIIGDDGSVIKVQTQVCKSVFDENKKFNPQYGEIDSILECDTVIFAAGQITTPIEGLNIEQKSGGRFVCDHYTLATSSAKIFIAGDNCGSSIVIQAMALGRKAALSVDRFLKNEDLHKDRDFVSEWSFATNLHLDLPRDAKNLPRKQTSKRNVEERILDFKEVDLGFDEKTAIEEASRCFHCECKKCLEECLLLEDYTEYPGKLFADFEEQGCIDPIIPYSCNMCRNCTLVCPDKFEIADVFASMRRDFVLANNGKSPLKGHKAIDTHQNLGFSKLFTIKVKGGENGR